MCFFLLFSGSENRARGRWLGVRGGLGMRTHHGHDDFLRHLSHLRDPFLRDVARHLAMHRLFFPQTSLKRAHTPSHRQQHFSGCLGVWCSRYNYTTGHKCTVQRLLIISPNGAQAAQDDACTTCESTPRRTHSSYTYSRCTRRSMYYPFPAFILVPVCSIRHVRVFVNLMKKK